MELDLDQARRRAKELLRSRPADVAERRLAQDPSLATAGLDIALVLPATTTPSQPELRRHSKAPTATR
jgi:hypothetical protein